MKKINKVWILTIVLSVIAAIEGLVVIYDVLRSSPDKYQLATASVAVPRQIVKIQPFIFEMNVEKELSEKLSALRSQINRPLLEKMIEGQEKEQNTTSDSANVEISEDSEKKTKVEDMNSSALKTEGGAVMVAVVIDDMGVSVPHTRDILSLEKPVTASFLTYGAANRKQVITAKEKGVEVMLHVPMMPHSKADLAPVTLSPDMSEDEIKNDLAQMLDRYKGLGMKGINNHMGSLFTEDEKSLSSVMQILKERNLFFLDSKTTAKSVGAKVAAEYGVPYIARDVFLDNENDYNYIMKQLRQTEKIAHMRGYAVAIGHPRSQTYLALRDWIKELPERKIRLVRLGDLVREVNKKTKN